MAPGFVNTPTSTFSHNRSRNALSFCAIPSQLPYRVYPSNIRRSPFISLKASTGLGVSKQEESQIAVTTDNESFGFAQPAFKDAVEGEWFGYECSFSVRDGKAKNIQERYVPDEYLSWGVEIKGFDCLTSSKCLDDGSLLVKRTRALPSVGCEADAVVPEVAEQIYLSATKDNINGGFTDGSISCGPAVMTDELSQRWNVCLVDPTEGNRSRVRLEFGPVNQPFGQVTVFIEHWEGKFCNGEVLPGCGGKNGSFAEDDGLDVSALTGNWSVDRTTYQTESDGWIKECCTVRTERNQANAEDEVNVALPRGLSVGVKEADDGSSEVIAGWMTSHDKRVVVRSAYDSTGSLRYVSRDIETRQS